MSKGNRDPVLNSMIRRASFFNKHFTDNEIVENLVMCSSSVINGYCEKYIDVVIKKFLYEVIIKDTSVYLFLDGNKPLALNCVLGQEILCPQILMPSFNQLYELYEWEKKNSMCEPLCIDDYVKLHVRRLLRKLYEYEQMVRNPYVSADDYFSNISHGSVIRYSLLEDKKEAVKKIQEKISECKSKEVPSYITLDLFNSLIRVKKIVEGLKEYL